MARAILSIMAALSLSATSGALEYGVGPLKESDTIQFNSSAKLEFIHGETSHINGGFSFDPENPAGGVKGILRVDLRTLKTGIDKRDEHMRDNHLHTAEFPYAYFQIDSLSPIPTLANFDSIYTSTVWGKFYIHGNFRKIVAALELDRKKLPAGGEVIDVRAKFSIKLDNFKISRPKALFLKLAQTIEIEAKFTGSNLSDHKSVELPDWPELK
jgi:polyisoprenoid-binding protein YceI